ncbi:MAG: glycosyltransferase family 4 protein [Chloroflexi bacterium]|nr:glycosyltransferase family 4 protein [Chloroflexota bacterium]
MSNIQGLQQPVHLITGALDEHGGISRYCRELYKRLKERMPVRLCSLRPPPLARRFTFLEHLPLSVEPDEGQGIYHFTRIMGCALMLWQPVHPAVATVHDLGPLVCAEEAHAVNPFDALLFRLQLAGLRRMDAIITRSHYTRKTVYERLDIDPGKVHVAAGGIDLEHFQRVPQARAKLEQVYGIAQRPERYNLLYVGSEAPRKNLATLLQAVALLKADGIRARLIKVGGPGHPKHRTAFLARAEELHLNLGEDIILMGLVPDADLATFYSAADVLVLPSLVEGFGFPVLEAMACGTPVACSNAGALPEVAGDAALLFEPHDARGLAHVISVLLYDTDLRRHMMQRGLEQCRLFSWDRMATETEAVYREILHPDT